MKGRILSVGMHVDCVMVMKCSVAMCLMLPLGKTQNPIHTHPSVLQILQFSGSLAGQGKDRLGHLEEIQ